MKRRYFIGAGGLWPLAATRAVEPVQAAQHIRSRNVLATYAAVVPLGWVVFVELPTKEANSPAL